MTSRKNRPPAAPGAAGLTHATIVAEVGDIGAARIAAIEATGASLGQFEQAAAWAAGESDVLGAARQHPDPVVQAVYEILTADEAYGEERG